MENDPKPDMLRSWKEISAYLGYDERTCYRWEHKYGMPVHRAGGSAGSKSHVVAYKGELDHWFRETFTNATHPPAAGAAEKRSPRKWLLLGLIPVAAALAFTLFRPWKGPKDQPVDFAIRGSTLIILGEDERELWRRDTKVEGLQDETFYRTYFQTVDTSRSNTRLPSLVIKDINGDGRNEVLLAVQKRDDAYGEGDVYCYDSKGRDLWHFSAGREMRFGGRTYSADYRIYGFALHDFDRDGRPEIVVISFHYPQWPCQLAVLDCQGRLIGEFWNSGQLKDIGFHDLDGDGREEMITAGVNNQYGPCLVVFDPARVSGCSPQSGEFKTDDIPAGSEKNYIIFPRTDVSLAMGDIVEGFAHLGVTRNGHVVAETGTGIMYELGPGLRCLGATWGHSYMRKHNDLAATGKIRSVLDAAYAETLNRGIRYWNGRAWTAAPAPNRAGLSARTEKPARAAVDGRTP